MCGAAPPAGTTRSAVTSAVAAKTPSRLHTDRLPPQRRDHPAQALLERHLGLPAEDLLRPRDVRLPLLGIVDRQGLVDDLALRTGDADHGFGELEQRELVRIAEVHGQVLAGLREQDESADQIVDVAERPRLRPVAEYGQRCILERL